VGSTALFVTYDEHDGYFDHVLPPAAGPVGRASISRSRTRSFTVAAGTVTATLSVRGKVGASLAVYPDRYLPPAPTAFTVVKGSDQTTPRPSTGPRTPTG
jgi:hypothetical protein